MEFKGSKINLPYFLLNSLNKMDFTIQHTIMDQDRSMFDHEFLKVVSQYHLSYLGRTWDEFFDKNGFGKTQYWPSPLP